MPAAKYVPWQRQTRKNNKERLVKEFGGKCVRCGFNGCVEAMDFHHIDPSTKEKGIFATTKYETLKKEAEKCILVCSNCHREIHARLRELNKPR